MKLTFTKLATISAVVLTLAVINSPSAHAVCRTTATNATFDSQLPEDMAICATVANTFATALTDINFGTIGATNAAGEFGCLVLNTDSTYNEANDACTGRTAGLPALARVVARAASGTAGILAVDNAFPTQEIRLAFNVTSNAIACVDGAADPATGLLLGRIFTDGATGAEWNFDTDVATSNTNATMGSFMTDNTGDVTILVGAEIQNSGTADRYLTGECQGTFDLTMFY